MQWEWSHCLVTFQKQGGKKSPAKAKEFQSLYHLKGQIAMTVIQGKRDAHHRREMGEQEAKVLKLYLANRKHMWFLEHRSLFLDANFMAKQQKP